MDKNRNFSKSSDLTIQTIIDSLEHPFYIINVSDYSIILSNKAAKLNIKTKNNTCFELTHKFKKPCNTNLHKCPIEIIKKSKKSESVEHIHFDKYGKEKILKINAIPIFDDNGELYQIIEYSYDITAGKKKDIELKKQEIKFKNLIDNSNDGVYLLYKGKIEITNKSFRDMFGVSEEEVVSDKFNFMNLISPKSISALKKRDQKLRNGKKVENSYIFTAIGNGGNEIEVETSVSYINYKSGVATLGNIRDITKRRQMEQRMLQNQKLESLGELAGGIAHDFNNILSSIYGFAELAVDKLTKESKTHYYVEQILKSADKGKDLVDHIMAFTRKDDANLEEINLGEVIKECIKLIKPLVPSTTRIRQNIQTDQSFIKASSTHIYQILINICTNASYAMGGNNGLIGITLDEINLNNKSYINPSLKPGKYIRLIVSDTGSGISKDAQHKIFDPFFTTKPIGEGTGMGLSVVYRIVKSHRGEISVHSKEGEGSVFTILFPKIEPSAKKEVEDTIPLVGGTEKILFVDDEDNIVEIFNKILSSAGYDVTATNSSRNALNLFRKNKDKFDLVITDHTMPEITGIQLAKEIKKERKDIPIILCSGYSDVNLKFKSWEKNFENFLNKPVKQIELLGSIRQALDKSKLKYK